MASHPPAIPIKVDDESGVWSTDGLPMLYVPRHFFINNHTAVEEAIGAEKYAELLYLAGYKSAYFWCEKEAATHEIKGAEVFDHYMKRLSQRGWGLFFIENLDVSQGKARIRLENSAFVLHYGKVGRKVDYMFTGWFAGAMDQVTEGIGFPIKTRSAQLQSASQEGCDFGLFEVGPIG